LKDLEAVKRYRIPVEALKDLVDSYFEVKRKVLEVILNHIKFNRKAHLEFKNNDRRRLRDRLLKDWRCSKHYVDSAINSIIELVRGWIKLYNEGAEGLPEITRKTVYVRNTLFSLRDGIIKISIEPSKRHLEVDLSRCRWIPSDFTQCKPNEYNSIHRWEDGEV
jgi:hypothetical protein